MPVSRENPPSRLPFVDLARRLAGLDCALTNDMAAVDRFYAAVAKEIADGVIETATWTKAFAHSGGDDLATKSLYCRYRAEKLDNSSRRHAKQVRTADAKHHGTQLFRGILVLVIGIGVGAISYSATELGGWHLVATGLFLYGLRESIRGFAGLAKTGMAAIPSTE
jgi:hypothetical protein